MSFISDFGDWSTYFQYKSLTVSPVIVNAVAANTMTVTNNGPTVAFYLKVSVSGGTTGDGTVTITGIRQGATTAATETLTFQTNNTQRSLYQYRASSSGSPTVTAITTSGLANELVKPTIKVDACDSAGNPISVATWTNVLGFWEDENSGYYNESGVWTKTAAIITTGTVLPVGTIVRRNSTSPEWSIKKQDASIDPLDNTEIISLYI